MVKQQGREAGHSPPASAKVKKMWIYTSVPPIRFHDVVLNYLSAETTLLLFTDSHILIGQVPRLTASERNQMVCIVVCSVASSFMMISAFVVGVVFHIYVLSSVMPTTPHHRFRV
jgi:hypothetical protein